MSHLVYDTVTPHLRIGVRGSIPYFVFHFSLFFQFSVLPFFIFWYFSFFLKKKSSFFILALTGASPKTLFLTPFFFKGTILGERRRKKKGPVSQSHAQEILLFACVETPCSGLKHMWHWTRSSIFNTSCRSRLLLCRGRVFWTRCATG